MYGISKDTYSGSDLAPLFGTGKVVEPLLQYGYRWWSFF
jgi:hypothetical protein